ELRAELRSNRDDFRTETDTDAICAALRHCGIEKALASFNGMLALAWLDERERKLIVARDRAGKKPLYMRSTRDAFTFASELKGLLAMTGGRYELDLEVAKAFLDQSLLDASPRTFLKGIESLPGGSYLTLDLDAPELNPVVREYWRPSTTPGDDLGLDAAGESALIQQVHDLFHDAVRLRLRSDVPVGLLLSGGVDSSAIACAVHAQKGGADVAMLAA